MAITINSVVQPDPTQDTIVVTGTDDSGVSLTASGWMSAMTNFYPPEDYNTDGNLVNGAIPRAMTDSEKTAYWQSLLVAVAPPVTPQPVVLFGQ